MSFKPEVWLEVKTRYEMGEGIRDIGRKHKIAPSGIIAHAKKNAWVHGKNKQLVNAAQKIEQEIKKDIHNKVELKIIDKIIAERKQIAEQIHNMSKGVLTVSGKALKIADEELKLNQTIEAAGKAVYIAEKANNNIQKVAELYTFKPTHINEQEEDNRVIINIAGV